MHAFIDRKNEAFGCIHGNIMFWTLEDMSEATVLLNKAEKAVASNPVLLERVRRDRMPLDLMWLQRYAELKQAAETQGVAFVGPADTHAAAQDFVGRLKQWEAKGFGCGQGIDILIKQLGSAYPATK